MNDAWKKQHASAEFHLLLHSYRNAIVDFAVVVFKTNHRGLWMAKTSLRRRETFEAHVWKSFDVRLGFSADFSVPEHTAIALK